MAKTTRNAPEVELHWARSWLIEVGEARKALDRAESIKELRRAKAFSIADPLGHAGGHGKGGVSDPMRKVDDMIDGEAEDATYGWAREALALFDRMAELNKPLFRGQLLSGLDIAEMRYRLGASDNQIIRAFCIGKSKLYEDLGAFVDYLDYLGPERTFRIDEVGQTELPPASDMGSDDSSAHGDVYGQIDRLVAHCGHDNGKST